MKPGIELTAADEPKAVGPHAPAAYVRVWDPVVRIFHWSVVTGCAIDYFLLTDGEAAHRWIGYLIGTALVMRVLWGVAAQGHARFSGFVKGPRATFAYVRALISGDAPRHIGHNPAAAVMILTLMVTLSVIILTGWMQTTDAYWGVGWVIDAHRWAANGLLALVAVHASAAVLESFRHRENLILAMVTGNKRPQ